MPRGATLIGRWLRGPLERYGLPYMRKARLRKSTYTLSISCPWITAEHAALPTDDPSS